MPAVRNALLICALTGLSGCGYSKVHVGDDFGQAFRQSVASQIADPDARYEGVIQPGSDGSRVALAQDRYRTGKVIQPQASTSQIRQAAGGGGAPPQ